MSKGATTTTQEVPDYLQDLYTEASTRGLEASSMGFQPYTGEMVAGFTPDQAQAMGATRGLFGQAMALDPRSALAGLARQGTPTLQAASLLDTDIARYQDPYTEQVLEPALADIQRRQDMAQQQAGLLGGELSEQYRTLGLLSGIGGQQRALEQARIQAQRAEFERELDFPLRQLGLLQAASGQISPAVIGQRQQKETGLGDILSAGAGLTAAAFTGGLVPPPKKT